MNQSKKISLKYKQKIKIKFITIMIPIFPNIHINPPVITAAIIVPKTAYITIAPICLKKGFLLFIDFKSLI